MTVVAVAVVMFAVVKVLLPLTDRPGAVNVPVVVMSPDALTVPVTDKFPLTFAVPVTFRPFTKLTAELVSEVMVSTLSSDIVALFFDV